MHTNHHHQKPFLCCLAIILCLMTPTAMAADTPALEYQIKASYLYNILMFVTSTSDNNPNPTNPIPTNPNPTSPNTKSSNTTSETLTLGILGSDRFGAAIDKIAGQKVQGKTITVRRFRNITEAEPCQVLFISASENNTIDEILQWVDGRKILTVSEVNHTGRLGTVINFIKVDNTIRFEINRAAAQEASLIISSELLRVAATVYE